MVHISPILPHSPLQSAMYDDSIYTQIETAKPFMRFWDLYQTYIV